MRVDDVELMVSGLLVGAPVVTYEGNPFHPGPERLWQIAADEGLTHFGVSAKYIDAVRNADLRLAVKST